MPENSFTSPALDGRGRRRERVAILGVAVALLAVGCGGGTSQDELERRIVELEDELERVATATTEPGPATTVAPPTTVAPTTTGPPPTTTTAPPATTTTAAPVEGLFFDFRGFGPIEAGMSLRTVEAVAGIEANVDREVFEIFEGYCYYATLEESRFADLSLLIVSPDERPVNDPLDGIIGSVSAYRPGPTTSEGVGVGSTEADVYAAYPDRVTSLPHAYQDGGRYLDVASRAADGSVFYLRFATDGVTVTSISSGSDEARNVEGCA